MKDSRLIPIWLWITVIIIIILLSSSCRGGRSLGSGSAGTVILPQTPQEINRSHELETPPDFQPLPPIPIIPPRSNPVPVEPTYSGPDVKIINESVAPKPSFPKETKTEPKPLSKTPAGLIAGDGGCPVIITPLPENLPTDNKATDSEIILDPRESDGTLNPQPLPSLFGLHDGSFSWIGLLFEYLLFVVIAIFIWAIYDIIKFSKTKKQLKNVKKKRKTKKRGSKKKLKEYKKTIPKGAFLKNNEKLK